MIGDQLGEMRSGGAETERGSAGEGSPHAAWPGPGGGKLLHKLEP